MRVGHKYFIQIDSDIPRFHLLFWKFSKKRWKWQFIGKEAIRNLSSYNFSKDKHALSYGLDHHIPGIIAWTEINTEFELFDQHIVRDVSNFLEHNIDRTKTKLYGTTKFHKIDTSGKVDDLPIRPIISNIGTAT